MQDTPFDPETIAIGVAHIARQIPVPRPAQALPPGGHARLTAAGFTRIARRLSETGIGPVAGGRVLLASPDVLDPVLAALDLLYSGELPITTYQTAFGTCGVLTTRGRDILIDPLTGFVQIIEGDDGSEEDATLFLEMDMATQVAAAIAEARDPDRLVDLDGRDLFKVVAERLGPLAAGQIYASTLAPDDPEHFRATSFAVTDLVGLILSRNAAETFEISRSALSETGAAPGQAWGEDWGEE